jgi:hypothetical protein
VLRPAAREIYRVYDEHAFLSGAPAQDPPSELLERTATRAGALAAVALLLAAVGACALVALDGAAPLAEPGTRQPRELLARTRREHAIAPAPLLPGGRARARRTRSRRERAARLARARGAGESRDGATAPAPSRPVGAPSAAAVSSTVSRVQPTEFGFER